MIANINCRVVHLYRSRWIGVKPHHAGLCTSTERTGDSSSMIGVLLFRPSDECARLLSL